MKDKNCDFFKVRVYGRTELAQMYSPNITAQAAYYKLMRWIRLSPELSQRFIKNGKPSRTRFFTPEEVRFIVGILGEP